MKYNLDIYLDFGNGYVLVTNHEAVKKIDPATFVREKDQMYYRIQLGEITFTNVPLFKLYDIINLTSFETEIKIKIVYGNLEVEGYFAKIDCKFDDDKDGKIIVAKPAIEDQYRRFLENYETEIDINDNSWTYESVTVKLVSDQLSTKSYWEYGASWNAAGYARKEVKESDFDDIARTDDTIDFHGFFFSTNKPKLDLLSNSGLNPSYDARDVDSLTIRDLIDVYSADGYELSELTVWGGDPWGTGIWPDVRRIQFFLTCKLSREFVFIPTSDGTETGTKIDPVGEGWIQLNETPTFSIRNTGVYGYKFGRPPFNGAYGVNGDVDWILEDTVYNDGTAATEGFTWHQYRTTKANYPFSEEDEGNFKISSLIDVKELLTYMYRQLHPDLSDKNVESLFFWNDNEVDFDFMENNYGNNYITNLPNELNYLKCFHTYSLKTEVSEDEEDEDSKLKLSIKKVIQDLQKFYPIFPFIDNNRNLHLEHVKYFELMMSIYDISTRKELEMTNKFEFDTSQLFDEKIFTQINAGYVDFVNNSMKFAQAVSNNRNKDIKNEVTTEIFTTDLRYCIENPNDLNNGLVLVLAKNGEIINAPGLVSQTDQLNGALSLSQTLVKYWRYEGVWTSGKINDTDYEFINALRSKTGVEIQFRGINPSLFYLTQISDGLLDDGSIDFENENTKVKLRYRYQSTGSGAGGGGEYLIFEEDGIYDFENYEI